MSYQNPRAFNQALLEFPKAVSAAVVLTAVFGLFDFRAMSHMWRVSRFDFFAARSRLALYCSWGSCKGS
jgi:hypothetical protein